MSKSSKVYQTLTFVFGFALAGILLAMGIIAVQKSMKLNMSFQINPSIYVKVEIYNTSKSQYETIFQNTNSTEIKSGVILSGNTLQFANDYAATLGTSLKMKVTSLNEGITMLTEFSGASVTSGGNTITATATTYNVASAELTVSTLTGLTMTFVQAFTVDVSGVDASSTTITAGQNVYTINGTYYVKSTATNAQFTLTSKEHYATPPTISGITGATYTFANNTLTLTKVTGDVSINASASAATYTVSSSLSGISSNTIANKATYNTNYTFTLTVASTSWTMGAVTYTVGGGSAQTLSGTTTDNLTYTYTIPGNKITGAIVINATATSSYSIYATINGEDVLIGEYSQKSTEQPITINYPSTFTYTGDLMSAVTGVSEVTTTQITIEANTTGDITIVPKGYWIGTYTSTYPNETVYDYDAKANIKVGTVWDGYKFLQFNGATDYGSYPMRWIIIGGDSANSTSTYGVGANKEYDAFSAKQVLLLSEKTLVSKQFHGSSAAWTGSTLQTWLNTQDTSGNFLPDSKMQSYYDNIATVTLQTAWSPNSDSSSTVLVELTDQKIFLLASKHGYQGNATNLKDTSGNYTYQSQNYMVEEYLGDETTYPGLGYEHNNSTTCLKMFAFSGSNTSQNSYWWLRSGCYDYSRGAYDVYRSGRVFSHDVISYGGVRPSFILNLA